MTTVTVSPRFQVVIPQVIRDALGIKPGQRIQALQYQDRIELIPLRPMRKARGMLEGIDTSVKRDHAWFDDFVALRTAP
ncbi:AbrB/MazE/SpoVT family DNA-binding domain-containing protein [Steroidobacter cummioxidans]|uniref:AbrB/MazE/SpoVT family DNA-binding domain-containing protein n=1 Tax=Steroidobacter cummioxidans TaxID=1803913 RepID=UPI000E318553|nr:AbrB/MazE/SpoVT family DNA-binding domain-containing protein [Steroidobacter cummioxidans]